MDEVHYEQTIASKWTARAYELLEDEVLHVEVHTKGGVVSARVWGICPRCGHDLDDRQVQTAVADLMTRGGEHPPLGVIPPIDITCGCGQSHIGAPERVTGCGVSFRVEVEPDVGSGGGPASG